MSRWHGQHIVLVMTSDIVSDQRMQRVASAILDTGAAVTMVGRSFDQALPLADAQWEQIRIKPSSPSGPLMYYSFNRQAEQVLRRLAPDLIYAADLDTVIAADRAGRQLGVPWIFDAHEYFTEVPELLGRPIKRYLWRLISRRVRHATAAITVNDSLASVLGRIYRRDFTVIRNVPEYHPLVDRRVNRGRRLIYQGAINKGRWVEHYIDLMPTLPDDVTLHVYGDGDLMPQVRQQADNSSSKDQIFLYGKLPPTTLREHTTMGWLGLNLLEVESKNYYYSLANKFFDYMHGGLPSINSCLPEYEAIIQRDHVGVCIDNTMEALRSQVMAFYESPALLSRYQSAARQAASKYCWQEEKKRLLVLLDQQLTT